MSHPEPVEHSKLLLLCRRRFYVLPLSSSELPSHCVEELWQSLASGSGQLHYINSNCSALLHCKNCKISLVGNIEVDLTTAVALLYSIGLPLAVRPRRISPFFIPRHSVTAARISSLPTRASLVSLRKTNLLMRSISSCWIHATAYSHSCLHGIQVVQFTAQRS